MPSSRGFGWRCSDEGRQDAVQGNIAISLRGNGRFCQKPYIVIDGKKIEPAAPKMKVWRAFLKEADKDRSNNALEAFLDDQVQLIVLAFGRPEVVNEDTIDENLDIADVVPLVRKLFHWIQVETFQKLAEAPNAKRSRA